MIGGRAEERVAVLGAGSFGRALARHLATNAPVSLWSPDGPAMPAAGEPALPEAVRQTADVAEAAAADVLFLCVPAHGARDVARALGDVVRGDQVLIHAARGLEASSGLTVSAVMQEETCLRKLGVIGGALRAGALDRGRVVAAVVASRFEEVSRRAAALLRGPAFHVLGSADVAGVELAGAYRSICAVWVGVVDALDLGPAARAMVMTEGITEATRLATRLGADPLTFTGYAGVGDLVATAAEPTGVEHEAGALLVKGAAGGAAAGPAPAALAAEAAAAAEGACALAARLGVAAPGAEGLLRLLRHGGDADAMLRAVLDQLSGERR